LTIGTDARLNGAKLASFDDFRDDMIVLFNNYRLLHPDEGGPARSEVLIVPDADASTTPTFRELARIWQTLPQGFSAQVLAVRPDHVDTMTLGRIERPESCAYPLVLKSTGRHFGTFGELLLAMSEAPEQIVVAPQD
jgi:hypothetical protein